MEFDYVIVGGGSAGSVLAARLSEDPSVTVCLIEAGGEGRDIFVRAPIGVAALLPGRPKINNWAYQTVPQAGLNGRKGYQPRGRALGGSSAINAMLYVRGHPSDYDDWAAAGCGGWGWEDVLPFFRRAERNERGADALHGDGGPLQVGNQRSPRPVTQAFLDACAESQIRVHDDLNGPDYEGAAKFQVTQFFDGDRVGERCSVAAAYLHPAMNRKNLKVLTRAHATGLVLDGKRAVGACYRQGGEDKAVGARREVIVSGGAFNSPQLLLLSGIGPGEELKRHGIAVAHELPGVGHGGVIPPKDAFAEILTKKRPPLSKTVSHRFRYTTQARDGWLRQTQFSGDPWTSQQLIVSPANNETVGEAMTAMLKEKLGYLGGKIDGQTIHIETHLCGQIEVLLNDDLVDLDKPITIVVDGTVRFEGTAKRKLRTLLDIAKDDWEFQRLFPVRFEVGRKGKAVQR